MVLRERDIRPSITVTSRLLMGVLFLLLNGNAVDVASFGSSRRGAIRIGEIRARDTRCIVAIDATKVL
jgi:hypothetical protein